MLKNMKDLNFYIEFVERHMILFATPGLPIIELYAPLYETLGAQQIRDIPFSVLKTITFHKLSRKSLGFWACVVALIAKYIGREIKAMHPVLLATHFFSVLVDIFCWVIDTLKSGDTEPCKIESNRDPPKIFIPIPKIESNGCARSDLPIRSLIF